MLFRSGVPGKYLSLQGMRRYFQENPQELWPTMLTNPSYVFFERGKDGPYGSAATIIVPGHSIAVDRAFFPMGAVAMLKALGHQNIAVCEIDPRKWPSAQALGALRTIDPSQADASTQLASLSGGVWGVLDLVGAESTALLGLAALQIGRAHV